MTAVPPPPRSPVARWVRRAVVGIGVVLLVLFGLEAYRVSGGLNEHTVVPGRVYRVAQPTEAQLKDVTARHGIRTVLNLRGTTPWDEWYVGECRATFDADVSQEDVTLSAQTLPFPAELKRVVDVLDRTEYPVLIHCKQGADRTGLVAAVALLLHTDASVGEARRQLLPRYGHWPVARTVNIDRFFDLYEDTLRGEGGTHTPDRFRRWVSSEYCPGPARSSLRWETPPPPSVTPETPFTVRLRAENRSDTPWHMTPGHFAGVHASYAVYADTPPAVCEGRSGLRRETVPPGGGTVIPIPVSGLKAGKYRLVVELHDATAAGIPFRTQSFTKFGDDSLVAEFVVQ